MGIPVTVHAASERLTVIVYRPPHEGSFIQRGSDRFIHISKSCFYILLIKLKTSRKKLTQPFGLITYC